MPSSSRFDLNSPPTADEPDEYGALRAWLDGEGALPARVDEDAAEALVDALVRRGDAERLGQLAAGRDKALSKQARRGIHVLRTRGVKAEVARPQASAPPPGLAAEEPELPSLVTAPLRDGEQLVWYISTTPSGWVRICQASVQDATGLTRFEMYRASRKQWRNMERSIEAESKLPVTHVPSPWARWIIEEAYQKSLAAGGRPPREYAESRATLPPFAAVERHPGLDVAEEDAVRAVSDPERVLELPEAKSWIPDEASVRAVLAELAEIKKSPLHLDEAQRRERENEAVHRAAAEALKAGLRARLSRRLLDLAYFLTRAALDGPKGARDYAADATLCVAGAWHMEDPEVSPEDNRVGRRLYTRLFDRMPRGDDGPVPDEGGGSVDPGGGGTLITP